MSRDYKSLDSAIATLQMYSANKGQAWLTCDESSAVLRRIDELELLDAARSKELGALEVENTRLRKQLVESMARVDDLRALLKHAHRVVEVCPRETGSSPCAICDELDEPEEPA